MNRHASPIMLLFITTPEATNTGPGFNLGSGGGVRVCGFEERAGAHARTEGFIFYSHRCVCVCVFLHVSPLKRQFTYAGSGCQT